MTADNTDEKQLYALALLKPPSDPYQAALEISGNDVSRALVMSREWPQDPEVVKYKDEEISNPTTYHGILAKARVMGFELLSAAEKSVYIKQRLILQAEDPANVGKDAIAALKILAEIEGLISTGVGSVVNNTLIDNRRVMKYKDHGTDTQWESKLISQQDRLINAATVN